MINNLLRYFKIYPFNKAPFMHTQWEEWQRTQPLKGLKVIHHVPLVQNTLLKIACLSAAGADVTVTNLTFLTTPSECVKALNAAGITYVDNLVKLKNQSFDLYLDCCAELFLTLGRPRLGAVELTASGDEIYRAQQLNFPVISIDHTFTKQLETLFGTAESVTEAFTKLGIDLKNKKWLLFGFGKIGRGIAYNCVKHSAPIIIADVNPDARNHAKAFNLQTIDPDDCASVQNALSATDIVVTATGKKSLLESYPKAWFAKKILINMGAVDEYGEQFAENEVLNNKLPLNFILEDPTPIEYIDPTFYAHNIAALEFLKKPLKSGVSNLPQLIDFEIIDHWCQWHKMQKEQVTRWFSS